MMSFTRWFFAAIIALALAVGLFGFFYAFMIGPVVSQDARPDNDMRLEIHPEGHPATCGAKSPEPLRAAYRAAGQCETDSQCVVVDQMCPLGCNLSVNRANLDDYYAAIKEFRRNNCEHCMYRCIAGSDAQRCVDGQCKLPRLAEPQPIVRPADPTYSG